MLPRLASPHLTDEAVAAYADGVLSSGPYGRAQQHLSACVECSAAVRDQRAARFMLRAAIAPAVPGSLLERLRQLPTTEPTRGLPFAALSMDGQAVFAAFDTRQQMSTDGSHDFAAPVVAAPTRPTPPTVDRRRPHLSVPVLGFSAAALIVSALAGTASAAGGATARPAGPVVNQRPTVNQVAPNVGDDLGAVTSVPAISIIGQK